MNETENTSIALESAGAEELRGELQSLRMLVSAALILVIIFSVCVDWYLSTQTAEIRRAVFMEQQEVNNFGPSSTRAAEFWNKLVEYSRTHPDFTPIIDKWKANISVHTNGPPSKVK